MYENKVVHTEMYLLNIEISNQFDVKKWRMALREAANSVGWDSSVIRFFLYFLFLLNWPTLKS